MITQGSIPSSHFQNSFKLPAPFPNLNFSHIPLDDLLKLLGA